MLLLMVFNFNCTLLKYRNTIKFCILPWILWDWYILLSDLTVYIYREREIFYTQSDVIWNGTISNLYKLYLFTYLFATHMIISILTYRIVSNSSGQGDFLVTIKHWVTGQAFLNSSRQEH